MKIKFFLLIFASFQTIILSQSDNSFFINLLKIEFEAFQKKDPSQWIKFVDENATFTDAENFNKNRGQIIAEMDNVSNIFLSATESYENVLTKIYGSTAVLSCLTTFSFKTPDGNMNTLRFKFIRVHVKDGDDWKLVYHSAVPI